MGLVLRFVVGSIVSSLLVSASAEAQTSPKLFAGVVGGVSTLSADARSEVTENGVDLSLYNPENGPALNVLFGIAVHRYFTVQANYIWNRNDVTLTSARSTAAGQASYEQPRTASQHAIVGDVLAYFRDDRSRMRPYLSAGVGIVRIETQARGDGRSNNLAPPQASLQATHGLLRVAVGIDFKMSRGWSARYSFSESLSANSISAQLTPPAPRNLANFQNLFGVVFAF